MSELAHKLNSTAKALQDKHYCLISGGDIQAMLNCSSTEQTIFQQCWRYLKQDNYMMDGGTYRFRRYGQFDKARSSEKLVLLPHEAYVQPSYINNLNGDISRHFEPLTLPFVSSPVLTKLLLWMSETYDAVLGEAQDWNIRLHPYRITSDSKQIGKPTPEGLHRDGVTFIASLLIDRVNIEGGETRITDNQKSRLTETTLLQPFDLMLANDELTMHDVSPLVTKQAGEPAYRDVLVIAFTKKEN